MRSVLFVSSAMVGMALAAAAFAQNAEPYSTKASHIEAQSGSVVAPQLPTPPGGENASGRTFLRDAEMALNQNRTEEAHEALERAETAFLDNPRAPVEDNHQAQNSAQQVTEQARQALGRGDIAQAKSLIHQALAQVSSPSSGAAPGGSMATNTGNTMGSSNNFGATAAPVNGSSPRNQSEARGPQTGNAGGASHGPPDLASPTPGAPVGEGQ